MPAFRRSLAWSRRAVLVQLSGFCCRGVGLPFKESQVPFGLGALIGDLFWGSFL